MGKYEKVQSREHPEFWAIVLHAPDGRRWTVADTLTPATAELLLSVLDYANPSALRDVVEAARKYADWIDSVWSVCESELREAIGNTNYMEVHAKAVALATALSALDAEGGG